MSKHLLEISDNDIVMVSAILYTVNLRSRKLAVIEEVKTVEGYRNRGLGKLIMDLAITKAKELQCDTVELCYNPRDQLATKLYKKCGFEEDGNIRTKIVLNKNLQKIGKW